MIANVLCGIFGLSLVNVPIFIQLRKLTTVAVYSYDILILRKPLNYKICISVLIMTSGTLVAAYNDMAFDLLGYLFVIANNMLSTLYYQIGKKLVDQNKSLNAMS